MFDRLKREIQVVFERDPAVKSSLEVLLTYPGLHAIMTHRLTHWMYNKKWYLSARMLSQFSRFLTGIEIHPGAKIGEGLFIDHGAGVVIGETAEVGDNVTIYQGVTLGGTGKEKGKRHPTIGNNVVISSGAKVLGSFCVGDNVKIGAGSVVLKTVPDNCTVVGVPGKVVVKNGQRVGTVPEIDLRHDLLPDPVADALTALKDGLQRLEKRVDELERENHMLKVELKKKGAEDCD